MSVSLSNPIRLLSISPFDSLENKSPEQVRSSEQSKPMSETVNPHEIQRLVAKGVFSKSKRSHYSIGDVNASLSCGPVLQIIPRNSEVVVQENKTIFASKQNIFDWKNIINENEIGIKIGTDDNDFLLLVGKNGCVLVESGAFVNVCNDVTKGSVFVIKPDGQYAQLTNDRQIVRLYDGGHIVLIGFQTTVILVGASGFDETRIMSSDFQSPEVVSKPKPIQSKEEVMISLEPQEIKLLAKEEPKPPIYETKPVKVVEKKESKPLVKPQKSIANNQKFKEKLPKSTFEDLNKLSSDHEFLEMIDDLPPNKWYFRGNFGGNQFICKVYNKDLLPSVQRHHYLNGELCIANDLLTGKLKNDNLVKVLKVINNEHNVFLFMDSSPRTALDVVMKNGPQNEMTSKKFIRQMLIAVDYLHSNGISHRDIKLENIYVEDKQEFVFKLSNFSCAIKCLKAGELILDNTWIGSEEYMSPEVLERVKHDPRTQDIWCLGVCLFLYLYDCFPFRSGPQIRTNEGRNAMLNRQLSRKYLIRSTIKLSVDCIRVYRSLMTPEFQSRPNAKQALKQEWIQE